ncbi:MAG: hypothetical protein ACTHJS_01840 [Xanthobacteraceae bacterium]
MAQQHIIHPLFELSARDPSFRSAASSWAVETRCEMDGMVADTKRMIASSKVLLAEAALILAQQTAPPKGKRGASSGRTRRLVPSDFGCHRQAIAHNRTTLAPNMGERNRRREARHGRGEWRDRAAEMRALSLEMKDFEARTLMLKLANDYDKLADRVEDRVARDAPRPSPTPKVR